MHSGVRAAGLRVRHPKSRMSTYQRNARKDFSPKTSVVKAF